LEIQTKIIAGKSTKIVFTILAISVQYKSIIIKLVRYTFEHDSKSSIGLLRWFRNEERRDILRFIHRIRRRRDAYDEERRGSDKQTPRRLMHASHVQIPNLEAFGDRIPSLPVSLVSHGDEENARKTAIM